jgi:methyl-accepting chemotaxis protein
METNGDKRSFGLTVGARLLSGFLALCLPLLLLIIFLIPKVSSIVSLSHKINIQSIPQLLDAQTLQTQDALEQWIITGDPKNKEDFINIWDEINDDRSRWDQLIHSLGNPKLQQDWDKLQDLFVALYNTQTAIINAPTSPYNPKNIENIRSKTRDYIKGIIDQFDGIYYPQTKKRVGGIYNLISQKTAENTNQINKDLISLKHFAYGLLIFAILLTIIIPYITLRAISVPIDKAINIAHRIAAGERDVAIKIQSKDKMGKLLSSLKSMQEAIRKNEGILRTKEEESRELFENLVNSSKKFREHSSKIAAGDLRERLEIDKEDILQDLGKDLNSMTDGLASITKKITKVSSEIVTMVGTILTSANEQTESITSQASAINEISASLEEIDKSSKQTMAKAQALREVAKNTYEQGKLGSKSVEQSIEGIKASEEKMELIAQTILDLSSHTQQIGDITSLVNTLSQQSKMLALNASIEASKAGEAGKGFAAVATEVRNLAEQSEQSTAQVQKILEDIRRTTEKAVTVTEEGAKTLDSGTKLIEKAGQVIETLSKMINDASISSQHIEVAIRQEAVGIEQIVESMNEINRATATFSSGIKEMMAFIHKLDDIAKHLKEDVNIYKV